MFNVNKWHYVDEFIYKMLFMFNWTKILVNIVCIVFDYAQVLRRCSSLSFPTEWTPNFQDFVRRLMDENPETRLGANGTQEIKDHPFFARIEWDSLLGWEVEPYWKPEVVPLNDDEPAHYTHLKDAVKAAFELDPQNLLAMTMAGEDSEADAISHQDQKLFEEWDFISAERLKEELEAIREMEGEKFIVRESAANEIEARRVEVSCYYIWIRFTILITFSLFFFSCHSPFSFASSIRLFSNRC